MRGRITAVHGANAGWPGCEECLLSPVCPAWTPAGTGGYGIEVAVRVLHRGDRLFNPGEPFHSVCMVRSGALKTCAVSASGEERVIGFHASGDLLGLDAIGAGRHVSSAIALDTASVCTLPYEPLCRLSARSPRVQGRLLMKMSQRLRDAERRLGMLAMRGAGQRMASFLIGLLDACRGRGLRSDEVLLPMPRADIAAYLVLAVETVSRSLSRQQEAGVIDVRRNRIRILDEPALRAIAGGTDRNDAVPPARSASPAQWAPARPMGEDGGSDWSGRSGRRDPIRASEVALSHQQPERDQHRAGDRHLHAVVADRPGHPRESGEGEGEAEEQGGVQR